MESVTRNFGEKRLTGAAFLDEAQAFDTAWVDGHLYKLTVLNFSSYLVKTFLPTLMSERSKRPSKQRHSVTVACALAWHGCTSLLPPPKKKLFSQHVKDMLATSYHVELVLYANDAAIVTMYCKPTPLVSYLESYFNDLKRLLRKLRIALNFSKGTAMILKIGRRSPSRG